MIIKMVLNEISLIQEVFLKWVTSEICQKIHIGGSLFFWERVSRFSDDLGVFVCKTYTLDWGLRQSTLRQYLLFYCLLNDA